MPWTNVEDLAIEPLSKREEKQVDEYLRQKKIRPRFYTDANFPQPAVELLRRKGFDVLTAKEVGLTNHPDENHLAFVRKEGRVLLTCDRDFLNDRKYPLHTCPAIVVFDFGQGTEDDMLQAFQCLNVITHFPEMHDEWCKFDANRDGWTQKMRFLDGTTSRERNRFFRGQLQVWVEPEG